MTSAVPVDPADPLLEAVRIVGIGASAGGLAALEEFLAQTPPDTGMAFMVVQHLDPTQKAMLAELLQRVTSMPVREAKNGGRVAPNQVYVIPPNTELSLNGGLLRLATPSEPRGMRLPINILFSSLASAQGERAIAVVLSGMGSDGTLGLQAIKAVGGLILVQQPDTAQFDSMPHSAIASGCVDFIAPPAALPSHILNYIARLPEHTKTDAPDHNGSTSHADAQGSPLEEIFKLLQARTRHDFSNYKPNTVHRRIERRMAIHGLATPALYAEFLQHNMQEVDLLFKELLIGVTSFFRDGPVWQQLASVTLPELLARRAPGDKLRAWVIGCSTGEEAYSLAMVFTEATERLPKYRDCELQIFASDLSSDAIATARRGQYPSSISDTVSPGRLAQFFTPHNGSYRIGKRIRDMVLFAQHDVILDPPFTKLDLLSCRNLMIYFDAALQRRLLPLFHYSLKPGGVMLLGSSETVGRFNQLFIPLESKLRLYLRQDSTGANTPDFLLTSLPPLSRIKKELPMPPPSAPDSTAMENLQTAADRVLLQVYAPPAVVVNSTGDIIYISGRTGKYLEPAAGKANWNFHAMVREGLRAPLAEALKLAATQSEAVQLPHLRTQLSGVAQIVDVTVQTIREPAALQGMLMIVFRDVAAAPTGRRKAQTALEAAHAAEVQQCRDEIQTLREETRASKEELQSANEELQSTNEELQSANEELTTSKEEMQSMNEELQTINAEMQSKLDDLALAQSDLKNLLNSTDIAMLFLDKKLNVRRYTERASKIISLRESDIGRPLSDLTTSLQYPTLQDDTNETLRTLVFSEKQIFTSDARWFSVRIMPYRRIDNVIDGAVITFVDITETKELESRLRKDQAE
ncbi:chemotaxis protein CheB [Polaromonas sp.]|uniref:chemotaxis protein CheB n=1 Tax=Polaromonas sp. TaxID=1869339 RepID=UPI003750F336